MQLSKRAHNEIVEAIKQNGFDPREFERFGDDEVLELFHEPSKSKLAIWEGKTSRYALEWAVGGEPAIRRESDDLSPVSVWLSDIGRELEITDLWEEFEKGPAISALLEGQDNAPFSARELDEIAWWAKEVRQGAQETYSLSDVQMRVLEAKLDYVVGAAKRMGRLDWLNLTVGALLSALAGGILTPTVTRRVLQMLVTAVGHLFGHTLLQLPQ